MLVSKEVHTDQTCRPCTFNDVVSQVSNARCGLKTCLSTLKYDLQTEIDQDDGLKCDLNTDGSTSRIIVFTTGIVQTRLQALYAGNYWRVMWQDVVGFVPDVFTCANLRATSVQRWIPFSQHIIRMQAAVILQHVANVQEYTTSGGTNALWDQNPPGSLQYYHAVAADEGDRIMTQYQALQASSVSQVVAYLESPRTVLSLVPVVVANAVADTARVFELTFAMGALDVLMVKSIHLVFSGVISAGDPTPTTETHVVELSAHTHMTAAHRILVVNSDIRTLGYLTDATLIASVSHDMVVGLDVYDGTGQTWIRTRFSLRGGGVKTVLPCTLEQHAQGAFEIATPHDFDLVHTAFQAHMCTSDFGV